MFTQVFLFINCEIIHVIQFTKNDWIIDKKDSGLNYLQIDSHFLARSSGWKLVGSSCGDNIHNIHIMFPQKSPLIYIFMVHVVLHGTLLKIFFKITYIHTFLICTELFKCAKCTEEEDQEGKREIYWQNSVRIMFAHDIVYKQCTVSWRSAKYVILA